MRIADRDGRRRLDLTWSRSGRRLIVSVDAIAQALLDPDQCTRLGRFLSEPDEPPLSLLDEDDDAGRRLEARWSRSGQRLVLTVGAEDAREVELPLGQVDALRRFLSR